MVLAIDVGNTNTVYGLWDGRDWIATWRRATNASDTEDELAVWLKGLFDSLGLEFKVDGIICGSVVPQLNAALRYLGERWLKQPVHFLQNGPQVGMPVTYEPPTAVGADRIANALGALAKYNGPIIVVDFGTATTFDTISKDATYIGGAILPGVLLSSQALSQRTAKLPQIELEAPERVIGRNTVESLQAGVVLGYADAIDGLATRISAELGGEVRILSTGGLGAAFAKICKTIQQHEPNLTLDGLRIALGRLTAQP